MTLEKVRLVDFTTEELKAVYVALGLALVKAPNMLTIEQIQSVTLFQTQIVNACSQRAVEDKIIMN